MVVTWWIVAKVAVAETHCTADQEDNWRREWGGHIEFCHGSLRSKGVAMV